MNPEKTGFFYAVQIAPELAPERIKLGWSSDPSKRLLQYQCGAPTATLIGIWPCARYLERPTIKDLAKHSHRRLSHEVFDFHVIPLLLSEANEIFGTSGETGLHRIVGAARRQLAITDPDSSDSGTPLSAAQLAAALNVSEWTIVDWAKRGLIPHSRIGSKRFFDLDEVLAATRQPVRVQPRLVQRQEEEDFGEIRRLIARGGAVQPRTKKARASR